MKRVVFRVDNINDAMAFVTQRQHESVGLRDAHGLVPQDQAYEDERQLRGILGEWAVANLLGMRYIHTVNTFQAPDVFLPDGTPIQVRSTMKSNGDLVIRNNAKDKEVYVLTYWDKSTNVVYVKGWITAYQARRLAGSVPSIVQDRGGRGFPAIFVPESHLHPMEELINDSQHE